MKFFKGGDNARLYCKEFTTVEGIFYIVAAEMLPKKKEEEIEHNAQMLMFEYVSEIEKYLEAKQMKRKALAEKIKISPSYLTQVFRGDKPLNFVTIAKIEKALSIEFKTKAYLKGGPAHMIPIIEMSTLPKTNRRQVHK